jgi:hypothetical protein
MRVRRLKVDIIGTLCLLQLPARRATVKCAESSTRKCCRQKCPHFERRPSMSSAGRHRDACFDLSRHHSAYLHLGRMCIYKPTVQEVKPKLDARDLGRIVKCVNFSAKVEDRVGAWCLLFLLATSPATKLQSFLTQFVVQDQN